MMLCFVSLMTMMLLCVCVRVFVLLLLVLLLPRPTRHHYHHHHLASQQQQQSKQMATFAADVKKLEHALKQLKEEGSAAKKMVASLKAAHGWIADEEGFFGKVRAREVRFVMIRCCCCCCCCSRNNDCPSSSSFFFSSGCRAK